ncbi:MAG TPA: hypothetical protein PKD24_13020 [Pyrinomonadaceae bacterium]|nr:hypothetical protein [Pyrinomonadaceae bacterium]HMP65597.1 hypothetical protein [Pyrinomonadaceae bacterium]
MGEKNSCIIFCILVCIFAFANEAVSQKNLATVAELETALKKEREFRGNNAYRMETVSESYVDGQVVVLTRRVFEYSDSRMRAVRNIQEGDVTNETERIDADGFYYIRENRGPWEKHSSMSSLVTTSGLFPIPSFSIVCEQISVEDTFLDHRPARLFEKISIGRSEYGFTLGERNYWFREDGALLRFEETKGTFSPRILQEREVTTYEYDPSIKIEAPIP